MNLKEFIEETLKQVIDGVVEAQKHAESRSAKVSPGTEVQKVNFDVSVSVAEDKGTQGKAGLIVWSIGAGISSKIETVNTIAHKIQFSIPIQFPYKEHSEPMTPDRLKRMST